MAKRSRLAALISLKLGLEALLASSGPSEMPVFSLGERGSPEDSRTGGTKSGRGVSTTLGTSEAGASCWIGGGKAGALVPLDSAGGLLLIDSLIGAGVGDYSKGGLADIVIVLREF